jgi:2-oxoglutarate dehydrogenase E1 component
MNAVTFASRWNQGAIEEAYQRWQQDPTQVDASWRFFFEGFELARSTSLPQDAASSSAHTGMSHLVFAYRNLGHLLAHIDPLNDPPPSHPLLELDVCGLTTADLDRVFPITPFTGLEKVTLRDLLTALRETYCRSVGVEYMHIQDTFVRRWLQARMEPVRNKPPLQRRRKIRILMKLHYAELFEKFLHTRYLGQKRFSLEGAETIIPLLDAIVEKSCETGVQEMVLGMAHRGRLNVLANILHKPYQEIFAEFEDILAEDTVSGDGDVKYHVGFSSDYEGAKGGKIHLSLSPNPSHLEAVDPVVEGRMRAKQHLFQDTERKKGMPLLLHGDAAFAGQGLVAETLNLSNLTGYKTGGTIHVIINNQIGFTTSPVDARSTQYCTDVAKMIQAPIFHVNAEDPEACVYVAELAVEYRQQFGRDVVIDMICYRRHGHNEGDEPSFTQPVMYAKIKNKATISHIYTEQLIKQGDFTSEETSALDEEFQSRLRNAQKEVKEKPQRRSLNGFGGRWQGLQAGYNFAPVHTAVKEAELSRVAYTTLTLPEGFTVNPKIAKLLETRRHDIAHRRPLDWSFAETLAFGTLVAEGHSVRLSGQDSRRGTFSQRHAVLVDANTGEPYIPLFQLGTKEAHFQVFDSMLSEAAVLGFEFGYSLDDPNSLVLWEAQFGDFANGAQVIIDQFLCCSESKWQRASGLVLLLPHGYEGQGPEHSSARLERFLQLCAEDNMQVANVTTPAQYFHLLRRQLKRPFRKPLVLMTPKSLLRHKDCLSTISEFTDGCFVEIYPDLQTTPDKVRRVLLCSGKVYYDLKQYREEHGIKDVAIVRVEQLYPLHEEMLHKLLSRYRQVKEWVWVQEESQNMGAWGFMEPRLRAMLGSIACVSRDASASPATGSHTIHQREQKELVEVALTGSVPHLVRATNLLRSRRVEVAPPPAPPAEKGEKKRVAT